MLICKSPLRVSFLGGGTDFPKWYNQNDGMVISSAINKYCYVLLKTLPPFHDFKFRLRYFNEERVNKVSQIRHPVIRNVFKRKIQEKKGFELVYFGDVPALSGLGSSSAFTVSLLNLFREYNKKKMSKYDLAKEAIYYEQKILREKVGSQDQIASTFGGFNSIEFKNKNFTVKKIITSKKQIIDLEKSLLLVNTGISRFSKVIEKEKIENINKNKLNYFELFSLCKEAKQNINDSKNLKKTLSFYINESWKIKKKLAKGVSNNFLNELCNYGLRNGAIAGKLLGSGSGGFMMFILENQKSKKQLKNKLKKYVCVDVNFDLEGSRIISNLHDPYK